MKMNEPFADWLSRELQARGWSQSEAARRGGFSSTMLNQVINLQANAGLDFCRGISHAFQIPLEDVLRIAGILPPKARPLRVRYQVGDYTLSDRMIRLFERLPEGKQELMLQVLESMLDPVEPRIVGEAPEEEEEL